MLNYHFNFQLRTPFNFVLMNLIVTEFIMMTFGLPFDIVASYYQGWTLSYSSCLFLGFLMTITGKNTLQRTTSKGGILKLQLWTFTYVQLLNKPYQNEVVLREQKNFFKYCQPLYSYHAFEKDLDLLLL